MDTMNENELAQCWSALFMGLGNCQQLGHELKQKFAFLQDLKPSPSSVVNLGCSAKWDELTGYGGGLETFALMWTLGADKVVVVDINGDSINVLRRRVGELQEKYPQCFVEYTGCFEYLVADMTSQEEMSKLSPGQFELAYCSRVLLNIEHDCGLEGVEEAVREIARVVKPGGWAVSHEAGACEPYPAHYIEIFRKAGFGKLKVIRRPESISMPDFEIEYAVYERLRPALCPKERLPTKSLGPIRAPRGAHWRSHAHCSWSCSQGIFPHPRGWLNSWPLA